MKAVHFNKTDKTCKVVEIAKPTPQDDEVLVKVKFSALDTATPDVLSNSWVSYFLHAKADPLILGWHFSGIVEQLGAAASSDHSASSLNIGDEVWGHLEYDPAQKQGSFSEYITVKTNACAKVPDKSKVTLDKYAAVATEAMTALQAIRDDGGLEKDMHLLVVGAAGGVGSAAVSIGKQLGAHVTAICSSKDVDFVKSLGADRVLDPRF